MRFLQPFGLSSNYAVTTTRSVSIGTFGSIDNAILLFGLIYGWIPMVIVVSVLLAAVVTVLTRRATPATAAVVAQLPALVSVAFITQYAAVAWFSFGLAVSAQLAARRRRHSPLSPFPGTDHAEPSAHSVASSHAAPSADTASALREVHSS